MEDLMLKSAKRFLKGILNKPGFRSLAESWICLDYMSKNGKNQAKVTLKTPWACEFPDFDVDRSIKYNDEVFGDYFKYSDLPKDIIRGKKVLEIGPGENLGVGIDFLLNGAAKITSVDRFQSLRSTSEQKEVYAKMRIRLNDAGKAEFDRIVRMGEAGNAYHLNPDRYQYIPDTPLETLDTKLEPGEKFDIIISRAVLEHVYDLDRSLEMMDRLLKPGGYMIHEVDMRDHGMFTFLGLNPLTFLTISDSKWKKMTSHLGAPNRCLSDFFAMKFDAMGYEHRTLIKCILEGRRTIYKKEIRLLTDYSEAELGMVKSVRSRLLPRYKSLSDESLLVSVVFIVARKQTERE
jgi:SAM-dependent methyltransferase